MFWKIKQTITRKQSNEPFELGKRMAWVDEEFKRMNREMDAIFGSCCGDVKKEPCTDSQKAKQKPATENTAEQKPSPESAVNRRLEDNAISMLERILTAGGLPAGPDTGMPCRVEYDRAKGAFLVYLAGSPYRPYDL